MIQFLVEIFWLRFNFRLWSEDFADDVLVLFQFCVGWSSRNWGIRIKWNRLIERFMLVIYHGRKVSRWALQGPIVRVNP